MTLRMADADIPTLIAAYVGVLEDVNAVVADVDQAQWDAPTACPGWSVGDVVAHIIDIEWMIAGAPRPDHEPDWAALTHVANDFGRATELGVDVRRSHTPDQVRAELRELIDATEARLVDGPQRADAKVPGPFRETTLDRLIRLRTLDIWVHEQDILLALGRPPHLGSPAAWVSAQSMLSSLPTIWARTLHTEVSDSLRLELTGPGVHASITVLTTLEGVAVPVPGHQVPNPTRVLQLTWPEYVGYAAGRVPVRPTQSDADLLSALRITP